MKNERSFRGLSHRILACAHRGLLRFDFLQEVSTLLIDFSGSDTVEIWVKERSRLFRTSANGRQKSFRHETIPLSRRSSRPAGQTGPIADFSTLCTEILAGGVVGWSGDADRGFSYRLKGARRISRRRVLPPPETLSVLLLPVMSERRVTGILYLASKQRHFFPARDRLLYEDVAQSLADALIHRQTGVALRERLKELRCLYGIAQLAARPDLSLDVVMQSVAELLPPAWLYPEIATARLVLDGKSYASGPLQEGRSRQITDI